MIVEQLCFAQGDKAKGDNVIGPGEMCTVHFNQSLDGVIPSPSGVQFLSAAKAPTKFSQYPSDSLVVF